MSPVGGSRHYHGAGLGQVGIWGCPSCGEDNTGKIEQGCVHCGAGKPREAAPPAPEPEARQGDFATIWAEQHPDATIADAYRAGVQLGMQEGIKRTRQLQAQAEEPPAREPPPLLPEDDAKTYRTMVAALALFRDQVLAGRPEEVESGEWLSEQEATRVIDHLQELMHG